MAAVCSRRGHHFSKTVQLSITLLKGLGVAGDAHCGATVKHRSRVRQDPSQPNLRQVHLVATELQAELRQAGFAVEPGTIGENVATQGIDLLNLPRGTRLRLGDTATVEVTGLRNPCKQLDDDQPGLMAAVLGRDEHGGLVLRAGIMATVVEGGEVLPGAPIVVTLPLPPHVRLARV